MPGPCCDDLRRRALRACDEGERPSRVAKRFRIGRASVCLRLKQRREEGRDRPKKMGGGPPPVIRDAVEAALKRLVASDNRRTLAQHRDKLADETGASVPGRWAERSGAGGRRAKKKPLPAAERDAAAIAQARREWRTQLEAIAPERLVFLDESAALTNMGRPPAWSPRGTRAYGNRPVRPRDPAQHAGGARDGGCSRPP